MLKLKSKSLIISNFQDSQLQQHIDKLVQQSQERVNEKLQRLQQKQARVAEVQKKFVEWACKKENQIKEKLDKSSKNKSQHLSKIVKKCKDHEKYLGEKFKNYQNRKKANLKQAWKITQKYMHNAEGEQSSKGNLKSKQYKSGQASEQKLLNDKQMIKDSLQVPRQDFMTLYGNQNLIKSYGVHPKAINYSAKFLNISQEMHDYAQEEKQEDRERSRVRQKLQQTLDRFKKNNFQTQQSKIQELGEKFEKIQQGRMRKLGLLKKKKEQHQNHNLHTESGEKREKQTERIQSEESKVRERRVRDWSEINKHKRQEFFQMHLHNGSSYLSSQKIKFIKTKLAKKIAISAIQKKLYFQRLTH